MNMYIFNNVENYIKQKDRTILSLQIGLIVTSVLLVTSVSVINDLQHYIKQNLEGDKEQEV